MFKRMLIVLLLFALLVPLILYWISPVEPVSWKPDPISRLIGIFEKNNALDDVSIIAAGKLPEAEDIVFDANGWLYTGLNDGRIVKFDPNKPDEIIQVANTGGRPLGLRFDASNNLIVADAQLGLISVSPKTGDIKVLVDSFEGRKLLLVDHVDIAANGDIYFSDASGKFGLSTYLLDFIEASSTGAVYKYSPNTQTTTLLMEGLFFSNGVALGPNDAYLLVAETGRARILKHNLSAPAKGQTEVFIDSLPAMPDNIFFDEQGTFWVGLVAMRDWRIEKLSSAPTIRKIIGGIPAELLKPKESYGFVVGIDLEGDITHNLQTEFAYTRITAAIPHNNKLFLGSLESDSVAIYSFPEN
jgi:sugar lactone lactonase YvrE